MSLTNPNLVYTVIHEHITGKRVNPSSAAAFLDEFFKKKDKAKALMNFYHKIRGGARFLKGKNGKNGGNPTLGKQKRSRPSVNPPDKPPDKGMVKTHIPITRNQRPEEIENPSSVLPTTRGRDRPTDDEIFRKLAEAGGGNVSETAFIRPVPVIA